MAGLPLLLTAGGRGWSGGWRGSGGGVEGGEVEWRVKGWGGVEGGG